MSTAIIQPGAETPAHAGAGSGMVQFLHFRLGGERCAVRIESVREILDLPHATPLPLVPAFVHGVMNLRGSVVPVIDLAARMGLPPVTMSRTACVVVVDVKSGEDSPAQRLGMLVDAVHEVFDMASTSLEAVPRLGMGIEPRFIRSIARTRDQTLSEIDLDSVFDHQALSQLVAARHLTH